MLVLGIDPGSQFTGYGILEVNGSRERIVDYGVLKLESHKNHVDRLKQVYDRVSEIAARHQLDHCAIEMPVYAQNAQSLLKLGRAQAAAMMAVLNRSVPITEYTPKEVKKAVTGKGNATKEQVWYMVRAILSIDGDDTMMLDASDAIAVGLCHAHRLGHGTVTNHKSWESFVRANPGRVKT